MYQLPKELQYQIYKYDRTYYDIFENCLYDIRNALYVTYSVSHKRTPNKKDLIEIYKISKIGKKNFNPKQLQEYIKNTYKYKFIVDMYYSNDYHDIFRNFYDWFGKNSKNLPKIQKIEPDF